MTATRLRAGTRRFAATPRLAAVCKRHQRRGRRRDSDTKDGFKCSRRSRSLNRQAHFADYSTGPDRIFEFVHWSFWRLRAFAAKTTGFRIGVANDRNAKFANNFAAEIDIWSRTDHIRSLSRKRRHSANQCIELKALNITVWGLGRSGNGKRAMG